MKNIRKPAAVLCALAVAAGAGAPAFENVFDIDTAIVASADERPTSGKFGENITWSFDKANGVLTIGGTGSMGNASDAEWKDWATQVTSVVIKEGVTYVGDYAFRGLYNVTSISLPNSVTSIGSGSFENTSIETIKLPGKLKNIGLNAFENCKKLKSIAIPDSVTNIDYRAFQFCESLKNVVLPTELRTLGYMAFAGCKSLETIVIPAKVTSIDFDAFLNCSSLKDVIFFGSDVTFATVSYGVFKNCSPNLTIHCLQGSAVETYAKDQNIPYDYDLYIGVLFGDVNDDGAVNNSDISLLQQYLAGWSVSINYRAADVNIDRSVNTSDLSRLQQKLAGWQVALGVR